MLHDLSAKRNERWEVVFRKDFCGTEGVVRWCQNYY